MTLLIIAEDVFIMGRESAGGGKTRSKRLLGDGREKEKSSCEVGETPSTFKAILRQLESVGEQRKRRGRIAEKSRV